MLGIDLPAERIEGAVGAHAFGDVNECQRRLDGNGPVRQADLAHGPRQPAAHLHRPAHDRERRVHRHRLTIHDLHANGHHEMVGVADQGNASHDLVEDRRDDAAVGNSGYP